MIRWIFDYITKKGKFQTRIKPVQSIVYTYIHVAAFYGFYLLVTEKPFLTFFVGLLQILPATGFGVAAGAHRLWAHRAYQAKWPLKLILMLLETRSGQNTIHNWVLDHRIHHKYSDTNADPHSINRGFFFAHVGWLGMEKHRDYREKEKSIYREDIDNDPIVMFQNKYYYPLYLIICVIIPTWIPMYYWGETFNNSWYVGNMLTFVIALNITWCLNSFSHKYGRKPYDKNMRPTETPWLGMIGIGEGWHNYHHTFPWDYKNSEAQHFELKYIIWFIDFFAFIGWAYDLKTVSQKLIQKRVLRTGDGSHFFNKLENNNLVMSAKPDENLWGWDDVDMNEDERSAVEIK